MWSDVLNKKVSKLSDKQSWPAIDGSTEDASETSSNQLEERPVQSSAATKKSPLKKLHKPETFPQLSQHVQLIDEKVMKAYLSAQPNKKRRKKKEVSLEDFIKAKKETKMEIKRPIFKLPPPTIVFHKGKKREIPKKKRSMLKKNIIKIREKRKEESLKSLADVMEHLKLNPNPPQNLCKGESNQKTIRHSRNFRPYCDNLTSNELCERCEQLLRDLVRLQTRAHERNPTKAKSQRRYVVGISETRKFLELKRVKLLLIAPDLEPSPGPGGLDETVEVIKATAKSQKVPFAFALKRRKLGYVLLKKVPISCVAVLNYEGCEEVVQALLKELEMQKNMYKNCKIE